MALRIAPSSIVRCGSDIRIKGQVTGWDDEGKRVRVAWADGTATDEDPVDLIVTAATKWEHKPETLPGRLEEIGVSQADVDELITDCYLNAAARMNNDGIDAQLRFLVADMGGMENVVAEFKSRKVHE